ncbi:hypothetical protein D3C80_1179760 [compost metagenome]
MFDLIHELGDIGGRRFGFRRDALGRQEVQSISVFEITEGIMRGDDDALFRRDGGNLGLHLLVQSGKLGDIGIGIGGVCGATGLVDLAKCAGNVLHIDFRVLDRLPGMRVKFTVMVVAFMAVVVIVGLGGFVAVAGFFGLVVMAFLFLRFRMGMAGRFFGKFQRLDTLGQFNDRRLGAAGVDQPLQEAFKFKAIDQHDASLADGNRIGRARLIDMRIAIRTDERGDLDAVAADIFGEIGDNRETGHDLEFGSRSLRHQDRGEGKKACAGGKTEGSEHEGSPFFERCFQAVLWRPEPRRSPSKPRVPTRMESA